MAGVPIQVIYTVIPRIEAMHHDMALAGNFKAPWLSVITAWGPPRKIQDLIDNRLAADPAGDGIG